MLNVRELIRYDTAVMMYMYKIRYGLSPSYLKDVFHAADEFIMNL